MVGVGVATTAAQGRTAELRADSSVTSAAVDCGDMTKQSHREEEMSAADGLI